MECPNCNAPVTQREAEDGSLTIFCSDCGWGTDADAGEPEPAAQRPAVRNVALLWILAIAIFVGPYIALRLGIPHMLDIGPEVFDDAAGRLIANLNVHYWWVMAAYVFLAAVFTPTYDRDKVGLFGGFVDNPFSFEDDYHRHMRALAFFLLPGKVVAAALISTWRLAKG